MAPQKISELISFERLTQYKYRLPKEGKMRVDGVFYASKAILEDLTRIIHEGS